MNIIHIKKNKEISKITSFNYEKYEHSLNKLLSKLEPYLTIYFQKQIIKMFILIEKKE
jgi:hypothetical protein